VIYEHGKPWWDNIHMGNLLIRPQSVLAIMPAEKKKAIKLTIIYPKIQGLQREEFSGP
jgi:hypothetical protein